MENEENFFRIKVITDHTAQGTFVKDDLGRTLDGVKSVQYHLKTDERGAAIPVITLEIYDVPFETVSKGSLSGCLVTEQMSAVASKTDKPGVQRIGFEVVNLDKPPAED